MAAQYWLVKSEPTTFSIDDLKREKNTWWEGVRNYQARNFMMKDMKVGDLVLFYHSNTEPAGVVGIATVSHLAEPDPSQFVPSSDYYDPKATKEKPTWYCTQIKFQKKFKNILSLQKIKSIPELKKMILVQPGSRLSVQPVTEKEFQYIMKLSGE